MEHEQVVAECVRRDREGPGIVYRIQMNSHTFKLFVAGFFWSDLIEGERYCMVKNRNIFDTEEEARAAIERALNHEPLPNQEN
jgi:hypothetical protein